MTFSILTGAEIIAAYRAQEDLESYSSLECMIDAEIDKVFRRIDALTAILSKAHKLIAEEK